MTIFIQVENEFGHYHFIILVLDLWSCFQLPPMSVPFSYQRPDPGFLPNISKLLIHLSLKIRRCYIPTSRFLFISGFTFFPSASFILFDAVDGLHMWIFKKNSFFFGRKTTKLRDERREGMEKYKLKVIHNFLLKVFQFLTSAWLFEKKSFFSSSSLPLQFTRFFFLLFLIALNSVGGKCEWQIFQG